MVNGIKQFFGLLKGAVKGWSEDKVSRMGATLSYYMLFSFSPLLVILIALAGFVFGEAAVQGEIVLQFEATLGEQGAEAVQAMIENANQPQAGIKATLIGFLILFFGASGAFIELQTAVNQIWQTEVESRTGAWRWIRMRLIAFLLVLGVGMLLIFSLTLSTGTAVFMQYMENLFPIFAQILPFVEMIVTFMLMSFLFTLIYKLLPNVPLLWSDVVPAGLLTALLFSVSKSLIGFYLREAAIGSAYGAAGSFIVLLVWVYYSAQILFFGVEFSKVYTMRFGSLRSD